MFLGFESRMSVSFWVMVTDAVFFLGCQINAVFLSVLYFKQYFWRPVLFIRYFSYHSYSYHIVLKIY